MNLIVNKINSSKEYTLLISSTWDKYILHNFKRNNIQIHPMKTGWYLDSLQLYADELQALIKEYRIEKLNLLGSSKAGTACILLGSILCLDHHVAFRCFPFSPLTDITKDFFRTEEEKKKAPPSVFWLYEQDEFSASLRKYGKIATILRKLHATNLKIFFLYPSKGLYDEFRHYHCVKDIPCVQGVPIPLEIHNMLCVFWNKIKVGQDKVEVFEDRFDILTDVDQSYIQFLDLLPFDFDLDLYELVYNTDHFLNQLGTVNRLFEKTVL